MGGSTSGLFSGTQGSEPATTVTLPPHDSQLKHIFGARPGHLQDTPANRQLLLDLANTPLYYTGTDKIDRVWHSKINPDGSQYWVWSLNGVIREGGLNLTPRPWNDKTGFNQLQKPQITRRKNP
jgi:filamentous hemagglutinin